MTIDSADECPPDDQKDNAAQHRNRERREDGAVDGKRRSVGEVDNAQTGEKLDGGVAAERDETPEDQGVGDACKRTLDDRPALGDDVGNETDDAEANVIG